MVGVQSCCLDQYASYDVGNVHDKFQGCTVDVQVATVFHTSLGPTMCYVWKLNVNHYASHGVSVIL